MNATLWMESEFSFTYSKEGELTSVSLFGVPLPISHLPSIELEELEDAARRAAKSDREMQQENNHDEYRHTHCNE